MVEGFMVDMKMVGILVPKYHHKTSLIFTYFVISKLDCLGIARPKNVFISTIKPFH